MDFDEELDLETLTQLLDEDDDLSDNNGKTPLKTATETIAHKETVVPQSSQEKLTKVEIRSNLDSKPVTRILKDASIDIFSVPSNDSSPNVTEPVHSKASKHSSIEKNSVVHTADADSSDDDNQSYLTESGRMIKKRIALGKSYDSDKHRRVIKTWRDNEVNSTGSAGKSTNIVNKKESFLTEEYSGIKIINPLIPHGGMKTRMNGRRMIKMSFIRNFMKNGDIEGDWVTIGVVASKVPPKISKNGKTYSIWRMTDLHDTNKLVSVFLFGAVHVDHWKTAIGTVVGILNPSIMSDKEKGGDVTLSVDHTGKFMMMGTSKDFGHCKGRRKDGMPCTAIVNKSECEFCTYHVSREYRKVSSKRTELQTSYSGRQPSLKSKILKGQNVMYGGQMFTPELGRKSTEAKNSKDKLTLNNLKLKRKAEELECEERSKSNKRLSELSEHEIPKSGSSESQFITQQLSIPTAGSRNLFQHLVKKEKIETAEKREIVSITPKELLKIHEQQLKDRRKSLQHTSPGNMSLQKSTPQLGRGYQPGQDITFEVKSPVSRRSYSSQDIAKLRAIQSIKEKGPLLRKDPNAVKNVKSPETTNRIKMSVEKDSNTNKGEIEVSEKTDIKRSSLGSIDLNSEKIKQILNRKSSHAYELETEEVEKQETYFRNLEKKEQMEQKMATTTEIVCDVVSCKVCKYTAHQATDLCKSQGHPIRYHKAVKRFFSCNHCKRRTCAFTKFPTRSCRNCGGSSFERTGMMKPRSGPKLDNEVLNIRGDEIKFLNSMSTGVF